MSLGQFHESVPHHNTLVDENQALKAQNATTATALLRNVRENQALKEENAALRKQIDAVDKFYNTRFEHLYQEQKTLFTVYQDAIVRLSQELALANRPALTVEKIKKIEEVVGNMSDKERFEICPVCFDEHAKVTVGFDCENSMCSSCLKECITRKIDKCPLCKKVMVDFVVVVKSSV